MRRYSLIIVSLVVITIAGFIACNNGPSSVKQEAEVKDSSWFVKRGEYLVNSIGCDDCHSPKRMGEHGPEVIPELRLSGAQQNVKLPPIDTNQIKNGWSMFSPDFTATAGQWGVSFSGNLTSDETGIGNWTEENFIRALRKGKFKGLEGARDLLPPMPWFVYKNMNDDDLKSIYAYLKTTKPVKNVVPAPIALSEIR